MVAMAMEEGNMADDVVIEGNTTVSKSIDFFPLGRDLSQEVRDLSPVFCCTRSNAEIR